VPFRLVTVTSAGAPSFFPTTEFLPACERAGVAVIEVARGNGAPADTGRDDVLLVVTGPAGTPIDPAVQRLAEEWCEIYFLANRSGRHADLH
jgi:1,6-anhydro-N-acetylmuramate kinase